MTDSQTSNNLFLPDTYYHVTSKGSHLLSNAFMGKGWIVSVSAMREANPALQGMVTLHDVNPMLGPAEDVWERVRFQKAPVKPPRSGALFLFDDKGAAEAAAANWWDDGASVIVKARVRADSSIHRGHLGWIEEPQENWETAAASYWRGDANSRPPGHWETIVHGRVFFPDWEKEPFGFLTFT